MVRENNNGNGSHKIYEGEKEEEEATALQRRFRSQGWNVAGANLLAVSCWQAKSVYMYFRLVKDNNDFSYIMVPPPLGLYFVGKNLPSYTYNYIHGF